MFHTVVAAYNDSPEAERALITAIRLAKILNADLQAVTATADLPAYTAYAGVADPSLPRVLEADHAKFYQLLQQKARAIARPYGLDLQCQVVEGPGAEAIINFLREKKADLLVVGLHQRNFYLARLWSTVFELAQEAPCSVLGVH